MEKSTQYFIERKNGEIILSGKKESNSIKTSTDLTSLLSGPQVSSVQRTELEMIVSTLPQSYPVKAYEYSDEINTYQSHILN